MTIVTVLLFCVVLCRCDVLYIVTSIFSFAPNVRQTHILPGRSLFVRAV